MIETLAGDRYILQNTLGSGGMGTVYKGFDTQTEKPVAIKQLHSNLTDDQLIERFKREGEALRELNHPNIVKMLDAVEEDGKHFLVMEFVSGGDLSDLLKQGQVPLVRILNILIDLADALTRAHRLNIIHRDLKPANILIGDDGILRLTDFGVAHVGSKERVTDTDAIVGTIDYLPPEAFDGVKFDERGDIWAFGIILFEMLTGKRPFGGETIIQVLQSIVNDPIPDIDELRSDVPVALVDLTYRMLERNMDARIRSVRLIGLELEDILHGRSTQTPSIARFDVSESDIFAIKKHNLPLQTSLFVGREAELDELSKLIAEPSIRLITIIAPGGMGKTRLALEAAEQNLDHFDDGVYFVELAPLTLAEQIIHAIGTALDYKFQQDKRNAKQELLEFLLNKQILLIMDNFEHLLDGAGLVGELLTQTSDIQIVATSRQRLAQHGENILHLAGMDFPAWETPDDALEYAAVKLFLNSAKQVKPSFELKADNLDYVARICKQVQGMPLGIVLSAAWLEMLTPQEIASELEHSMDILADELGALPERQQSIRIVMDYAWQMMSEPEQAVFMKLSVFKGGFTRKAGQAVSGAGLQTLMSLVTKSLIRRETESGRYEIHELLRQYAYEKLTVLDSANFAYEQHAIYFSNFLAEQLPLLKGAGQTKSLADIDSDYENCHASWLWSVEHYKSDLIDRMIDSLYLYFQFNYGFDAGYRLFEMARQQWSLSLDESVALAGRLSVRFIGTEEQAIVQPILEKSLALAEKHSQLAEIAFCERELGRLFGHHSQGNQSLILQGLNYLRNSLKHCQQQNDRYFEALVLDDMGYTYARSGDFEKRLEYSEKSIELHKKIGDIIGYAGCVGGYASSLMNKDMDEALEVLLQACEFGYQNNNAQVVIPSMTSLGVVYMFMGNFEKAFESFQTVYQLSRTSKNEQGRLTGQFGMVATLCAMDRDIEQAKHYLLNDLPSDDSLLFNDSFIQFHYHNATLHYIARTGNDAALAIALREGIYYWKDFGPVITSLASLPLYAYIMGKQYHQPEIAIQWLSFSSHVQHPQKPLFYFKDWSIVTDFRETVRAKFGEEKFNALWETGKSLDIQTVFDQLIEVFESEA